MAEWRQEQNDIDSGEPTAREPDIGDGAVYAVVADNDRTVLAGGSFTQVGGQLVSRFPTLEP